jgi:glycosyltransferase involved in cell wall biosynthesis
MASCKGFIRAGLDVQLVAPRYTRPENIKDDEVYETYGIKENERFGVVHLPTHLTDFTSVSRIRINKLLAFSKFAFQRIIQQKEYKKYDFYVIYTKCLIAFLPFYYFTKLVRAKNVFIIYEASSFLGKYQERVLLKKFCRIVAINPFLKADIARSTRVEEKWIIVPPLGVDDSFEELMTISKEAAREKLDYLLTDFVAVYSGKIAIEEKSEIEMILESARLLPDVKFILTGGRKDNINYYLQLASRRGIKNAFFTGFFKRQKDTFVFLRAADVLLSFYPKSASNLRHSIPEKIIQYARARRPIICARSPAIEYMLGVEGAVYVEPENVMDLAQAIERIKKKIINTNEIVAAAWRRIQTQSYQERTKVILDFILEREVQGADQQPFARLKNRKQMASE